MSATALAGCLVIALGLVALTLNHLLARVGIVELSLSQGPQLRPTPTLDQEQTPEFDTAMAVALLPSDSLSVFVSATCVACARLVDDLAAPDLVHPFQLDLYFADRRSPLARRGEVHENQAELFTALAVPVTPYAVRLRAGEVVAHGGVADLDALAALLDWQIRSEPVGSPA